MVTLMDSSSLGALLEPLVDRREQIIVARGRGDVGPSRDMALDLVDIQHRAERAKRELVRLRGQPGHDGGAGGRHAPVAPALPGRAEFPRSEAVDDLPQIPRAVSRQDLPVGQEIHHVTDLSLQLARLDIGHPVAMLREVGGEVPAHLADLLLALGGWAAVPTRRAGPAGPRPRTSWPAPAWTQRRSAPWRGCWGCPGHRKPFRRGRRPSRARAGRRAAWQASTGSRRDPAGRRPGPEVPESGSRTRERPGPEARAAA